MGEVFLARQSGGVDRLVILKNLLPELAEQEGFIDRFDEARVAATLNHPNIVSIFEVGAWKAFITSPWNTSMAKFNRLAQEGNKASAACQRPWWRNYCRGSPWFRSCAPREDRGGRSLKYCPP